MVRHKRIVRQTRNKSSEHHSGTFVSNVGPGKLVGEFEILETEGGLRTTTGASQTIQDSRSTAEVCNVGDLVKYVNLFIQCTPRVTADKNMGWLEWAFVCVKESEVSIPNTQIGVETLGVIAKRMYRNECIFTGFIPLGTSQANGQSISIKIPKTKSTLRMGDEWRLYTYFRSSNSAAVTDDDVRLIESFFYTCYH